MKEYRVERMTFENYHNMMMGSHYHMEAITVIAESKEQAVELAKKDGYMVNEKYVRTVEEIKKEEKERVRLANEKAEKAKAKRAEKMAQPGAKAKANYRRKNTEIKKMMEEIARLQKEIERAERAKENYAKQYKEETGEEEE